MRRIRMDANENQKQEESRAARYPHRRSNPHVHEVENILNWILIALTLALIFRAFVMEAFRIPTGSMADTLRGDHYHLRCTRCGYKYDLDIDTPNPRPQCPNCLYYLPQGTPITAYHGDRIFVLKCIYQFFEANRWDVIVFKNPINPVESYIKRLIGLPGETVQIIDGDIYINGRIARKPDRVQDELWMIVYDNNYQPPPRERSRTFEVDDEGNYSWTQPFKKDEGSAWSFNTDGPSVFSLDSEGDWVHGFYFDSLNGRRFRATYAYNRPDENRNLPICSDLKIDFDVRRKSSGGVIGAVLKKYSTYYSATLDFAGRMVIERTTSDGVTEVLAEKELRLAPGGAETFSFANVDHVLKFRAGSEVLIYDLGAGPDDAGRIHYNVQPEVRVFGSGRMVLNNLAVYRDLHYIEVPNRATRKEPFTLGPNEYFACGDNSPASLDSRYWSGPGKGNNGLRYSPGVVPGDYMVGKAFFVYWANAYRPMNSMAPLIPNIDQFQIIYGGVNGNSRED